MVLLHATASHANDDPVTPEPRCHNLWYKTRLYSHQLHQKYDVELQLTSLPNYVITKTQFVKVYYINKEICRHANH